jgi:DNA invertase Pin-like site-specific DNA recombinase
MFIGYARVSTDLQDVDAQKLALERAGCEKIFTEIGSGATCARPQLMKALEQLRAGDVLTVWKLDRLSRSMRDLLAILEQLKNMDVGFKSVTESIDTTTAAGNMQMQMIGVFAEFERNLIRERTKAGLELARKKGRYGGRPFKLDIIQREEIIEMVNSGQRTAADVARLMKVHRCTISRLLKKNK